MASPPFHSLLPHPNLLSLVTSSQHSSSTGWGPWSYAPYLLLRRRPLTTLSHPPPAAFAESQWVEPRSDASGTSTHVAGSLSEWLVLLPLVGICKYLPLLRDWHHWESTTLQQLPLYGVGKRSKSEPCIISTCPFSHYLQLTFPMISLGLVILHPGTIAGLQILCINNGPINKIGKP